MARGQNCPCDLDLTFIGNVVCDDNGTPGDPSDDTFTFELNYAGSGTGGTTWTASDAQGTNNATGTYGLPTIVGPIPLTSVIGTIYHFFVMDDLDPSCTSLGTSIVVDCNPTGCMILSSIVSEWCCDSNGTPDPTDDTYTVGFFVTGVQTSGSWTATGSSNHMGPYGTEVVFGPVPTGVVNSWVFQDAVDPSCMWTHTIGIIPSCSSSACQITSSGFTGLICVDPGTPGDPSDDYWEFTLDPTGMFLSGSYSVTVSSGLVSPTTANYGGPETFSWNNISNVSSFVITISDSLDPSCNLSLTVNVPPSGCGVVACIITATPANIVCDDNGTPTDPSDDIFTFDVLILGNGNSWTASDGSMGSYNTSTSYGPFFISNGVITIVYTDDDDPSCLVQLDVTPPPTCSNQCELFETIDDVFCNDNGTPSDPSDDVFFISLTIIGSNIGAGWTANDPLFSSGFYNTPIVIGPYDINGGMISFTTSDINDPLCNTFISLPHPAPCSSVIPCAIMNAGVGSVLCLDNNTPGDVSDDYLEISFNPTGVGLGTMYTISSSQVTVVPGIGNYGVSEVQTFLNAGSYPGQTFMVTIADIDDPTCFLTFDVVNEAPCPGCQIELDIGYDQCDDNDTPLDDSDDVFFVEIQISGMGTGTGWTSDDSNNPSGIYPELVLFGPFQISNGDVLLTLTDVDDPNCVNSILLEAPSPCSITCSLQAAQIENIHCDDNGTPSDSTDDYFTFDLNPMGGNLGSGYVVNSSGLTITPSQSTYGMTTSFSLTPGTAGGGDIVILISDIDSADCDLDILLDDPGTCSDSCIITAVISDVICDDLGTGDSSDDVFSFSLWVEGINMSDTWTSNLLSGNFEELYSIGPFLITDGLVSLEISDLLYSDCSFSIEVTPPSHCSQCAQVLDAGNGGQLNCNITTIQLEGVSSENGDYLWIGPSGMEWNDTIAIDVMDPGWYYLSATYLDGCTAIDSVQVTVDPDSPVADGGQDTILTCMIEEVVLNGSLGLNEVGYWYDEMSILLEQGQQLIVDSPGNYYYQVVDTIKNCTSPLDQVAVLDGMISPSVFIYTNPYDFLDCQILSIELSTDIEDHVLYTWTSFGESFAMPTLTVTLEGSYQLNALDTLTGCQSSNDIIITNLEQYPFINILEPNVLTCNTDMVTIDATGSQAGTNIFYSWYDNSFDPILGATTNSLTVGNSGIYYLQLFDSINGCINVDTIEVLEDMTTPLANASSDIFLPCGISETTLNLETSEDVNQLDILWTTSEGIILNGDTTTSPLIEGSGYYFVNVSFTSTGCQIIDSVYVDVDPSEFTVFINVEGESCIGAENGEILIMDYNMGLPPFQYFINGLESEEIELTNLSPGDYNIVVVDTQGCVWDTSVVIAEGLSDNINLTPVFYLECEASNVLSPDIAWSNDEIVSVTWSPSSAVSCAGCLETEIVTLEQTELSVEVISQSGCVLEAQVELIPCVNSDIYVPTAFSPNDDGINDVFTFFGKDLEGPFDFYVFDRWGEKVYELDQEANYDPTVGWDGKFKGIELESGVYVYLIRFVDKEGKGVVLYGDVTLLR